MLKGIATLPAGLLARLPTNEPCTAGKSGFYKLSNENEIMPHILLACKLDSPHRPEHSGLSPSFFEERGNVRWRTWGEWFIKYDNKLFLLLNPEEMIYFVSPDFGVSAVERF